MFYHRMGAIPHKRHTQFRSDAGELRHEELMGIHGFSGAQSLLYHLRPPTRVRDVEVLGDSRIEYLAGLPLKHRLLNTRSIPERGDAVSGRTPLMGNSDVLISVARPVEAMRYWRRFAHGDELIFVHEGAGLLETQFGELRYRPGDYLVLPTGVAWRMAPDAGSPQRQLVAQAWGHYEPPARYRNRSGQFLEHSPYCATYDRLMHCGRTTNSATLKSVSSPGT